jgi:adenylate cyclase
LTARTIELVQGVADEQRRRLRLAGYVSPQVAARAESLVDESAPGENRTVTVLFADLRGFTAMSETLPSDCVVSLLNEFHSRMVAAVSACEGTLDKYLGDGLMAYFGAPIPAADHAVRAILCALSMQKSLDEMNGARAARGEPPLRMGVGLHSGPVVLGRARLGRDASTGRRGLPLRAGVAARGAGEARVHSLLDASVDPGLVRREYRDGRPGQRAASVSPPVWRAPWLTPSESP